MSMQSGPILERLKALARDRFTQCPECKICGSKTKVAFALPKSKLTGHDIPDAENDCPYYECEVCHFLFATIHDRKDHGDLYDESYWDTQDPDWSGRVGQTLRLVMMANKILGLDPWKLKVLDFGCGMGAFIEAGRNHLQMEVWGTDIVKPKHGIEWFVPSPPDEMYDVVVSCEVIEHLPFPFETMTKIKGYLKPGGVFAFQTAYYDPGACDRNWWYLGPANGHISLYSKDSFDVLAERLGVRTRMMWNDYPGLQAWQF
jgi:SAM-dependent methyltransferase